MRALFVDTGAFLAKEIVGDQYHSVARHGWNEAELRGFRLVSSEHVFDESATLIARRTNYTFASEWGRDTLDSGIEWLRAEEEDLCKALGFMRKFADQGVSFTDCLSAILMKRVGLKKVFGFDRHFEAMGFGLWPGEPE